MVVSVSEAMFGAAVLVSLVICVCRAIAAKLSMKDLQLYSVVL